MMLEHNYQNYVCRLWRGFAAWVERDAVYRELAALDERGLKDIGITRGDIPGIVEGTFCGDGVGDGGRLWVRQPDHPVRCASTPP